MDFLTYLARIPGVFVASVLSALLVLYMAPSQALPVFINELHYDNAGGDVDEGVELAGPAGTDLADWQLFFYNGSSGSVYKTRSLSGLIPEGVAGIGFVEFLTGSLQNGPNDGLALVDADAGVQQFISYEGVITAASGPASGLTSVDIGVFEDGATAVGRSLQLTGTGSTVEDFFWAAGDSSFGRINEGQIFSPEPEIENVPEPTAPLLVASALLLLMLSQRQRKLPASETVTV